MYVCVCMSGCVFVFGQPGGLILKDCRGASAISSTGVNTRTYQGLKNPQCVVELHTDGVEPAVCVCVPVNPFNDFKVIFLQLRVVQLLAIYKKKI